MCEESFPFRNSQYHREFLDTTDLLENLASVSANNFEKSTFQFRYTLSCYNQSTFFIKRFIHSMINVIRFRPRLSPYFAKMCLILSDTIPNISNILLKQLRYADQMTPTHFYFYRLCVSNGLLKANSVIQQISSILYFNLYHIASFDPLIPLFLWFLPELEKYQLTLFSDIKRKFIKDSIKAYIKILRSNNWSLFYQCVENQYKENSVEFFIKEDNIDKFQQLVQLEDLNGTCCIPLFDFIIPYTQHPTYFQLACYHSAMRCFKFLVMNKADPRIVSLNSSFSHIMDLKSENIIENNHGSRINLKNATKHIQNPLKFSESYDDYSSDIVEIVQKNKESFEKDSEEDRQSYNSSKSSPIKDNNDFSDSSDVVTIEKDFFLSENNKTNKIKQKQKQKNNKNSESKNENNKENNNNKNDQTLVIDVEDSASSDYEENRDNDKKNAQNSHSISFDNEMNRFWLPPVRTDSFISEVSDENLLYVARAPLCIEYASSIKIATSPQYAIVGGNNEIVRHLHQSDLSFTDTPRIAILCFHNNIAKWLIDNVVHDESMMNKLPSIVLYFSIICGNLSMVHYTVLHFQVEINSINNSYIPLHLAIKFRQFEVFSYLLELENIDINIEDHNKKTPFFTAVDQKSLKMVKMITLHPLFNFDHIASQSLKPVHYVALYGTKKIMKYFLSLNCVDINSNTLYTPLVFSLLVDNMDNFFLLFNDKRIDLNISSDFMPMDICIRRNLDQILSLFLECDHVELNSFNKNGMTPLHVAIQHQNLFAIEGLLKTKKVDTKLVTRMEGDTPVHLAVKTDSIFILNLFLPAFDINSRNFDGQSILHYAAVNCCSNVVDIILSCENIDINASDKNGNTPLHNCIQSSSFYMLDLLLVRADIDINARNINGDTPLIYAFKIDSKKAITKLLNRRHMIDPNCFDEEGHSPLHFAVKIPDEHILVSLLKIRGINVNHQDFEGITPIHIAAQGKLDQFVRILLQVPDIRLDLTDSAFKCPLHYAAECIGGWFGMKMFNPYMYTSQKFSNTIFRQLITKDASTGNMKDGNGDTPFHISLLASSFDGNIFKNCEGLDVTLQNNRGVFFNWFLKILMNRTFI